MKLGKTSMWKNNPQNVAVYELKGQENAAKLVEVGVGSNENT